MKIQRLVFILIATAYFITIVYGQNYRLLQSIVTAGSEKGSSASYTLSGIIDPAGTGIGLSSSYEQSTGFWFQGNALQNYFTSYYPVASGWNMISVGQTVGDYRKSAVYPTSISNAFAFENEYRVKDTLQNRVGYWLKFPTAQSVGVTGLLRSNDTIPVQDKWNLIGTLGYNVATSSIVEIPGGIVSSEYFGFDNAYVTASVLESGKAYWVKTQGGGSLVLDAGPTSVSPSSTESAPAVLNDLNILTVKAQTRQSSMKSRMPKLHFGTADQNGMHLDRYEMPPLPPKGTLDIRFASNRFVEIFDGKQDEPQEIPLLIQSNGEALQLSWQLKEQKGFKYALLEREGTKIIAQHRLRTEGSITIDVQNINHFALRVERIPNQYMLYRNYPNPFNPSTTIRFDLPEPASVSLKVINVLGQEVEAPLNIQDIDEGQHSVEFTGSKLSSGTYFYQIVARGLTTGKVYQSVQKMVLLK